MIEMIYRAWHNGSKLFRKHMIHVEDIRRLVGAWGSEWEYITLRKGLKCDGKNRYEGDIVEFEYDTGYSRPVKRGVVKFGVHSVGDYGYAHETIGFFVQQTDIAGQTWSLLQEEIKNGKWLGNIYENPELEQRKSICVSCNDLER